MKKIKIVLVSSDEYKINSILEESDWFEIEPEKMYLLTEYLNRQKYYSSNEYIIINWIDHEALIEKTLRYAEEDIKKREEYEKRQAKQEKQRLARLKKTKEERDRKKYEELKKRFEDA